MTTMEAEHYVGRILDLLAKDTERTVVRWHETEISAAELRTSVLRVAAALRELGVEAGTTVAILTEVNSPWMLVTRYAVHLLGSTVVYVSGANHGTTTYAPPTEVRARMLRETEASVLLFDSANREEAETLRGLATRELGLCGLGAPVSGPVSANGHPVTDPLADVTPRAPGRALAIYTSGSTGRPKGVFKPFAAWNNIVMREPVQESPKAFLAVSAVSHTGGLLVDIAIASGGSVVLRTEFEPGSFLRDIARHRITDTLIGVPQFYLLVNHPDVHTTDLSSLRRFLYVGCPASPELVKEAVRIFPPVLHHTYGTTETGNIAILTAADHEVAARLDSVGRPRPEIEIAIRDPETGRDLPVGEVGEVVVRGAYNMEGYVEDPGLTEKVLRDGWVHTRDFGRLDEEGYLRLSGRMNDVAKVHDTRVHPAEVEKVLVGHKDVVDAYVYACRRSDLIEELHAAVVLKEDAPPSFAELRAHVGRAMTPTHAPAVFVRWREFPINTNGKVNRPLVREHSPRTETEGKDPLAIG